jgi:hypothetical protein
MEGLVFTGDSFAYFEGKRKKEGGKKDLTQRTQRKSTEGTEKSNPRGRRKAAPAFIC